MRILYHHRTLADGAEGIHIAEMVSAFRRFGHEVHIMGLATGSATSGRGGIVGRVRNLLPAPGYELATAACNAFEYRKLRSALMHWRPDFLYKRHARNDTAALEAARECKVPSVLEVNCLYSSADYQRFEPLAFRRLTARFERRALSLASFVLAVSTPLREQIRALGIPQVSALPNGANPATFRPNGLQRHSIRTRLGLPNAPTIGWAGILRDWHGLNLLLEAVARLDEVTLLIIGDGPGRAALEAQVRQLGLQGRVIVTGRVSHESMPEYLAALDIAVVADERTGVASPMKLLEYMAMGLPVVAPDLSNIRDLVVDDEDGMLFSPGDAIELSGALGRLARDADLRTRLGAGARAKIERDRNWDSNASTVLRMVTELVDGRGTQFSRKAEVG